MQLLNSPIEVGVRALIVLTTVFPTALDLTRLALMDHCLLHTADVGGPDSVLPEVPARSGELGVKRSVLTVGLQVMVRAGMVEVLATPEGLLYRAGDDAAPFLQLLRSEHVADLSTAARWVAEELGGLTEPELRGRLSDVSGRWRWEIEPPPMSEGSPW